MNKYIIVFCAIIVGALTILFLVRHPSLFTNDVNNLATNVSPGNITTKSLPITNPDNSKQMTTATLHTNKGDITVEFYEKDAPNTVANFLKLAKSGFYDGIKFHRVIKGFMIQGGDPLTKDDSKMASWGTGGPGYKFADEIDPNSDLYQTGYKKGIVAMANSGPNTNGSQFFIMNEDNPLPPLYTIFGKVDTGQDVVDAIALVKTVPDNNRPIDPVVINSITVQ